MPNCAQFINNVKLAAQPTIDIFVLPLDVAPFSATLAARHIATAAVKLTFTRIASLSLFLLRAFAIQDGALTNLSTFNRK